VSRILIRLACFIVLSALAICHANAQAVDPNCVHIAANEVDCDLLLAINAIGIGPGTFAALTNKTGGYIEINQVTAITNEQLYWSEFCVFRNNFMTGQLSPGVGEVGCTTKNIGESYPSLHWNGILLVAPGDKIYLGSHTEPDSINHLYLVTASAAFSPFSPSVQSFRTPKIDAPIPCSNAVQSTDWGPWTNNTGSIQYLSGATIYAVSAQSDPNTVSEACLYILNADGSVSWSFCNQGTNHRGTVSFSPQPIKPGQSVTGQAINQCSIGLWDWVAYMYIQTTPVSGS
jgi:hypothetical protein